jgi:hypothetical protein
MNPEPLVRVKPDHALNRCRKVSRIHFDVFVVVAGSN